MCGCSKFLTPFNFKVHQLRMQHQHLQVLQAQQQHQADTHYQGENGEPGKKKRLVRRMSLAFVLFKS